jgi:hypothetical protein
MRRFFRRGRRPCHGENRKLLKNRDILKCLAGILPLHSGTAVLNQSRAWTEFEKAILVLAFGFASVPSLAVMDMERPRGAATADDGPHPPPFGQ